MVLVRLIPRGDKTKQRNTDKVKLCALRPMGYLSLWWGRSKLSEGSVNSHDPGDFFTPFVEQCAGMGVASPIRINSLRAFLGR